MRNSQPFPIVISGPSGVGKTTLVDRLVAADDLLVESISTTTRAPREGEVSGTHYFFVERDVFEKMRDRELVEWAEVHGMYYGTPRRFVDQELEGGRDVVLNIDIQGGNSVKRAFPDAVMIFILPPSLSALEERLRIRGDVDAGVIRKRVEAARGEITGSNNYSYLVVNDELDRAEAALRSIIGAERCRRERINPEALKQLGQ